MRAAVDFLITAIWSCSPALYVNDQICPRWINIGWVSYLLRDNYRRKVSNLIFCIWLVVYGHNSDLASKSLCYLNLVDVALKSVMWNPQIINFNDNGFNLNPFLLSHSIPSGIGMVILRHCVILIQPKWRSASSAVSKVRTTCLLPNLPFSLWCNSNKMYKLFIFSFVRQNSACEFCMCALKLVATLAGSSQRGEVLPRLL